MENNEIDLWELILIGLGFFKKNKPIIISFFLLGLLFSISNFFTHPLEFKPFYKKDFIVASSITSSDILCDIINGIPPALTNLPKFRNLKGKVLMNNNKETRIDFTMELYEKKDADSLLHSITTYVDSIDSLREKFELGKKQKQQLLSLVKRKIAECDSSKKQTGYSEYLELIEKKQAIEKELTLDKIVDFIEVNPDFVFIKNIRSGILNILGYSFLGLVIGFFTAYFVPFIKKEK